MGVSVRVRECVYVCRVFYYSLDTVLFRIKYILNVGFQGNTRGVGFLNFFCLHSIFLFVNMESLKSGELRKLPSVMFTEKNDKCHE